MTTMAPEVAAPAAPVTGLPFATASRPQRRYQNVQTVNNANAGSFQVVQLPATGWVRRISLFFTASATAASGGALVAGDAPFNLISGITVTDATGQPIQQPISGYNLYLVKKQFATGSQATNSPSPWENPRMTPEYALAGTATTFNATFRLDVDFEIDARTGYGCIPNLDSNASLQLKVDFAALTVAYTGTGVAAQSLTMRTEVEYWAPVGNSIGGVPVSTAPPGAGDYAEVRYETQVANAGAENLITLTNRGGLVRGILLISRAAGVRTAVTPLSNLGILLDNQPINEGIPIESHYHQVRQMYGYFGAMNGTSLVPLAAGVMDGLDTGVVPVNFGALSLGRDSWLNTRAGSLFQVKITPGGGATTLEIVTILAQVKDANAFYNSGA